jgi:hypothetical protein
MNQQRAAAKRLSAEIDRLLSRAPLDRVSDELSVAQRLADLSDRLPPAPASLQRRVAAIVERADASYRPRPWRSAVWGAVTAAIVLFGLWMVIPSGQQVAAQVWRVLLGQTEVELTPTLQAPTRVEREPLRDLVAAELAMGRAPSLPKVLPDGYVLQEIAAVTYPDLPSWISQPFFVEFGYGLEGASPGLWLREYRLLFRDYGGISGIEVASGSVSERQKVDIAGAPGALLRFSGAREVVTVIWERDGLLLELETDCLDQEDLLAVARSTR